MENPKVKRIQFDFFYKGKWHRDLTMDYTKDDDVDKDYIYNEDGPWYMLDVGDDVIDFQIFSFDGNTLEVDACEMYKQDDVYHHGDILSRLGTAQSKKEYDFENIRVEYYQTPTQHDIHMMLLRSMDDDTARVLAQQMEKFVAENVMECADEDYNDDDVRLAVGRYLRDKLGVEE